MVEEEIKKKKKKKKDLKFIENDENLHMSMESNVGT